MCWGFEICTSSPEPWGWMECLLTTLKHYILQKKFFFQKHSLFTYHRTERSFLGTISSIESSSKENFSQ